jgi:hypothetical protein
VIRYILTERPHEVKLPDDLEPFCTWRSRNATPKSKPIWFWTKY